MRAANFDKVQQKSCGLATFWQPAYRPRARRQFTRQFGSRKRIRNSEGLGLEYPHDIAAWGQLGFAGEWADKPIHLYGMSINNQYGYPHGFSYFMMQRMMNDGEFKPGLVQMQDTATGPGMNYAFVEIVADVATDRYG